MSDDELIAELPRRMKNALESAQEVARELVARAREREQLIREETDRRAQDSIMRAESEATAILQRAAAEAVRRVHEAQAEARAILGSAHARREQVLTELQQRSEALEVRAIDLQREHDRLLRVYEVVDRTLDHARSALRETVTTAAAPPRPAEPEGRRGGRHGSEPPAHLYAVSGDTLAVDDKPAVSGMT